MVEIRPSSAFLSAIAKGRYRHQTGSANVIVTRKVRDRTGPVEGSPVEEQAEESDGNEQRAEP
jgi:hypothetical protein